MPEPGITDRNFTRPTTEPLRGPTGRRQRDQLKVPREYADFQLEDGRRAIDVLGEGFFEPRSGNKRTGEGQSKKSGNKSPDLPAGLYRDYAPPRPSGPPSGRTIPDGDNDAGFADLPFRPEEEDAADEGAGFPIAKPRPERGRGEYATEPLISEWSLAGKDPYAPRRIPTTGDGRVDVRELERGVTYEVEDGTRFGWDGENFRELYRDRNTGAWLLRTDPAGRRVAGHPGTAATPRELMDAAEDIQRETGRFRVEADRIRVLAIELAGEQDRLRNLRLNGLPDSDPRVRAALDRMADEMPILRKMYDDLVKAARPEIHSVERMAGRMDDPGRLENAANSAVQGGGDVLASIPIFMAISENSYAMRLNEAFDRVEDENIDNQIDFFKLGIPPNSREETIVRGYVLGDDEFRARLRKRYGVGDPRKSKLYQYGNRLRGYLEESFEINPKYASEFFATKLPNALGAALTKSAIVGVTTLAGVPVPVSKAVLGMMTESSGLFLDALQSGMPIDAAYGEFAFGALVGMTEGLSIADILGRAATEEADQAIRTLIRDAIISRSEDAAREAVLRIRAKAKEYKLAEDEEIESAFSKKARDEFALAMINPDRQTPL